jgi:hypothetical protein
MQKEGSRHTEILPLDFTLNGNKYTGSVAEPLLTSCREGECFEYNVNLNGAHVGTIYRGNAWTIRNLADQELVRKIGWEISLWYGKIP